MKSESKDGINSNYRRGKSFENDFKYKEAIKKYLLASKEGSAEAAYRLGLLYEKGLGVAFNMASSIKWYEIAAKRNHPLALYTLGVIYANGVYVKRDLKKSYKLFNLSKKYSKKNSFTYSNSLLNQLIVTIKQ